MHVRFHKNGLTKEVKAGFSWTVFFFGAFPFAFRGQWLVFIAMIFADMITVGLAHIVMAFFANKVTAVSLIESGWKTFDTTPASWGYSTTKEVI